MEAGSKAPNWIKSLVEKLGCLTPAPALAGLGALAITVLIDITFSTSTEENTKEALRAAFAEEKASEVWDQIDECLKRCRMNIKNQDELRSDIKRIECQLSEALTKLKNSMVRDGHMSSPALQAWVNGAAFHIQMLIHLVRLGGIQTCDPVKNLLSDYQSDLDQLFDKHKETIIKKCGFTTLPLPNEEPAVKVMVNEFGVCHNIRHDQTEAQSLEMYYSKKYGEQKPEIQQHFSEVSENLQSLVEQKGFFNV